MQQWKIISLGDQDRSAVEKLIDILKAQVQEELVAAGVG
jgi:hypothetical protein